MDQYIIIYVHVFNLSMTLRIKMECTYIAKGCIDKINVSCNAKRHNRDNNFLQVHVHVVLASHESHESYM